MLDIAKVRTIAEQAVRENLGASLVEDVYAEPGVDWTGEESLDVTVVVLKNAISNMKTGKELGAALSALCDRLVEQGEMRFPFMT